MKLPQLSFVLAICSAFVLCAAEPDTADLRMKFAPNDTLLYDWTINAVSDSTGKEKEKNFTLAADSTFTMTLVLKAMNIRAKDGTPVLIKVKDQTYHDKRSVENSKTDLFVAKGKMKYVENDKVVIDSDNDIGLDKFQAYQQQLKNIENAEMRATLDAAGRQSDVQGEPSLVDAIKNGGAQGIFPILAGREVKLGESWEDSFAMAKIAEFHLARPAQVRSKMTFSKWEEKNGRRLALIDMLTVWDSKDLKGENDDGMLVEITRVDGRGAGTCLFDPDSGRFVEGSITFNLRYRIDGEKDGQKSGLDVNGKTRFSFKAQPQAPN
ncbi:MAG TPA: hypothetical protein VEK08_12365 [Planctomycetota bacterium]|nr:hypothetical protein [Planctomycetota bacterium]